MRNSRKRSPASNSFRAWASSVSVSGNPRAMQIRGSKIRRGISATAYHSELQLQSGAEASLGWCRAWSSKPAWGTLCRRWVRLPLASANSSATPYLFPIDSEIRVDQDVAEGDDLRPWHSRISTSQCHRDASGSLANDRQLLDHGAAHHLRFLNPFEIDP